MSISYHLSQKKLSRPVWSILFHSTVHKAFMLTLAKLRKSHICWHKGYLTHTYLTLFAYIWTHTTTVYAIHKKTHQFFSLSVASLLHCFFLTVLSSAAFCARRLSIAVWNSDSCMGVQVWGRLRPNHTHHPAGRTMSRARIYNRCPSRQ